MAVLLGTWTSVIFLAIPFLASTIAAANEGRSFSVDQVSRVSKSQPLDISRIFARNLFRYGGEAPSSVVHSSETASVLALAQNQEFVVPVSVGASTLQLSIDTGSSDL